MREVQIFKRNLLISLLNFCYSNRAKSLPTHFYLLEYLKRLVHYFKLKIYPIDKTLFLVQITILYEKQSISMQNS